ncbi:inositol monophosphatase family protein [Planctomicrobium sp. SH668]|uniref:inositol monophosphatase family protein n=1 Tax=Planctomicrobium sp. SH668 TaxID=3448126 RepID=UPI003F5BB45F
MPLNDFSPEMKLAQSAALEAGALLLKYQKEGFTIREKGASDLVSEADVNAEQLIIQRIHAQFPGHAILAEESQTQLSGETVPEHLWIIDPLDGTTNFAHGIPHFAVSIGYYRHGVAECGVVFNPARNDLYVAAKGAGAFYGETKLQVGSQSSIKDCLIGLGFYYDRGAMMEATLATIHQLFQNGIHGVRRFGTASLDLAHVARGFYGAYFEYQLQPWDFAAGRLLVEEAGGRVTDARGDEIPFRKSSILASNGTVHQQMQTIIHETASRIWEH